jgi:hypothetical protein
LLNWLLVIEVPKQTFHDCLMAAMTKSEAEEVAAALCEAGWPFVYIEINDNGTWRAVAEDDSLRAGWLKRLMCAQTLT